MKNILTVLLGLYICGASNSAFSAVACNPASECRGGENSCYSPGWIICGPQQQQQCTVKEGRATWTSVEGSGFACNGSYKLTIIEATLKSQYGQKQIDERPTIAKECNNQEVCSFLPKGSGGLIGDATPGSHYYLYIKYICRSEAGSKGIA